MAGERETPWAAGESESRCIALSRSVAVRAAAFAFALVAALAVHGVIVPRGGSVAAIALAVATFGAVALATLAHERRQPASLSIEPGGVAAYDRSGAVILRGRIAGCAQWADRLLMIAVMPEGGTRAVPMLVTADALPPAAFRELAVCARHATR